MINKSKILILVALFLCVTLLDIANGKDKSGIKVYDADGQYLGILLDVASGFINVYIPSIKKVVRISPFYGILTLGVLYFESEDCTGKSYVGSSSTYSINQIAGKYYTGEEIAPISAQIKSVLLKSGCNASSFSIVVPAVEVTLPFTLPVALPLSFE